MYRLCVLALLIFLPCVRADADLADCSPGTPEIEDAEAKAPNTTKGVYSGWEQLGIDITQQCYDAWYSAVRDEFTKGKPAVCGEADCDEVQSYINDYQTVLCDTAGDCAGLHTLLTDSTLDFKELMCAWYYVDQGSELTCGAFLPTLSVLPLLIAAVIALLTSGFR